MTLQKALLLLVLVMGVALVSGCKKDEKTETPEPDAAVDADPGDPCDDAMCDEVDAGNAAPMWSCRATSFGNPMCMDYPKESPRLQGWVENEVRESILRDRNRTCVVQWELFNEVHRPILKQMMRPMALLTRELDPTRLILDESGGWAHGARMYLPNESEPIRFNDIHTYPGPFINERSFDGFLSIGMTEEEKRASGLKAKTPGRNVVPGLMSFVSELGYGSLPNLVDSNRRFAETGNPITPPAVYHQRLTQQHIQALEESGFEMT